MPRGSNAAGPLLLLLALAACSTGPWQPRDEPTPWIAPGERARLFSRSREVVGGNAVWERVWRDANGRDSVVYDIQDEIEEYLHESGVMEAWPESQSGNDKGQERLAPFRFTVVTVRPTVVLMSPFRFGSPLGRSTSEILEPVNDRKCLGNGYMINPLECDVTAPYAPEMMWFSHDLGKQPAPIPWANGRAGIDLGKGQRLLLVQEGATVRTERVAR